MHMLGERADDQNMWYPVWRQFLLSKCFWGRLTTTYDIVADRGTILREAYLSIENILVSTKVFNPNSVDCLLSIRFPSQIVHVCPVFTLWCSQKIGPQSSVSSIVEPCCASPNSFIRFISPWCCYLNLLNLVQCFVKCANEWQWPWPEAEMGHYPVITSSLWVVRPWEGPGICTRAVNDAECENSVWKRSRGCYNGSVELMENSITLLGYLSTQEGQIKVYIRTSSIKSDGLRSFKIPRGQHLGNRTMIGEIWYEKQKLRNSRTIGLTTDMINN